MKKILLASVALSAFAGAAAAEVSLTWGGTATVGMAREGGADAGSVNKTFTGLSDATTAAGIAADQETNQTAVLEALVAAIDADALTVMTTVDPQDAVTLNTPAADALAAALAANDGVELTLAEKVATIRALLESSATQAAALGLTANTKAIANVQGMLDEAFGSAAVDTGDFDSYAEANLTATLSVVTDYGITVTGAVSVDAGTGYDFADDDGFDAAKSAGSAAVSLDYVTIDGGSFGALTFDKDDIEHLVDADDDASADLKYTNDFGVASFAFVMDIAKDTDVTARKAGFELFEAGADISGYTFATSDTDVVTDLAVDAGIGYNKAVAADVAWSAMISAPIADMGTVYAAFDEEGGNAFGGSFMVANVTIGLDSKLEALEEELGEDRSNTISLAYAVDGLSLGAEWNSVEDGNQWAVNAAYEANGMAVAFDTNEAEEWTATASYDLSDAASVDLGVNYTEDAFVGLSLAF